MELWKLNTAFKLFLLSVAASFLVSAVLHNTLILHYLPVVLAVGAAIYVSIIINPTLRKRSFLAYLLGTLAVSTALVGSVVVVGYYSLSVNDACSPAVTVPLDWTGSVILDAERHPYLDAGITYQFTSNLLSGPGYRLRVTQDPLTTPILHYATISQSAGSDVWRFTPSSCGKYWVELLNLGFGSQASDYHIIIASVSA